ncbi:hypothetical protein MCC93_13310 [Morococcus cerebrosus]|uniref:Uncharacterized protein n=1 Tax=Morococcus cerebrosus TaxID=1056807 RepID=A0A0C1EFX6_9NEIS|nr:hypothetical protein MCC93_13310 [Morococcus cerebrosus]
MWKCCWQQKRSSENIPSYRNPVFRRPWVANPGDNAMNIAIYKRNVLPYGFL